MIQAKKSNRELLTELNELISKNLNTSVKERQQQQQYEHEAYTSFVELFRKPPSYNIWTIKQEWNRSKDKGGIANYFSFFIPCWNGHEYHNKERHCPQEMLRIRVR